MRRGARRALGLGATLIAMATASAACADVRFINLDECSATCSPSATDDATAAEDEPAGDVTLSLFGRGGTGDASGLRPDLIFDPEALPSVLVSGPASPIESVGAQAFDGPGVSPYAFFDTIIDIPLSVDTRSGISAAALFLFTPSTIGRLTLTDVLSDSRDLFKPLPPFVPRPEM
ncbi:MAG TPA: hypothetical protein VIJ63_16175 [Roseiarcus sp.]